MAKFRSNVTQRIQALNQRGAAVYRSYQVRVETLWGALSVRSKLTTLFGGLIVVMTIFFYGFAVFQTTREIKIGAVNRAQAIAEALKDDVAYALQIGSYPNLNFTFRRITSSRHNIAYVFLLDPAGEVLAHSEPEYIGRKMLDPLSRRTLAAPGSRIQFESRDLEGLGQISEMCDVSTPILVRGRRAATLRVGISITQSLLANEPRIRSRMALFALPFAFLSILIAMKLAGSITHPLRRLAQAATEVSRGNYDVQLPLNRQDELGEVAQAFNTMAQHLKEHFARVSDMANRDGLTGLYNARYIHETLEHELERVKRTGRPLSVLIFDVDFFKRINDRYGHPVGDQVLQHFSRIARSVLREYDVLARYGGEEFIAMLTETTGPQALLLAERLRKFVEQRPFVSEDGEAIRATMSVGVASAHAPYEKGALISEADQALYRAKETGRNKAVIFKTPSPEQTSLNIA